MNQAEKEAYLREYSILKNQGKPFFPYAVAKDSIMAFVVILVIIFLSLMFGAEMGPKADPTTTTYVPRPDWYFFFLFEVLRVIKPPVFTPMATIGVPTICMILLFLLPFYDRSPERVIWRRPIALSAGLVTIFAMAYLTYAGANAGSPNSVDMKAAGELHGAGGRDVQRGQACRRPVRLPGLPHDRGQRQQRTGTAADPHRLEAASGRDRLDAAKPDGPDAVVQEPGSARSAEVPESGQLPGRASVASAPGPAVTASARTKPDQSLGTLEDTQVRAMFDRISGVYDRMNSVMTAGLHHKWRRRAADLASLATGAHALDVATGTGDLAFELAGRVGPGGEVVGSDFSERMLSIAREKAAAQGSPVRFESADALALPYGDGTFDAATVGFGARNFSDLELGVSEMARVVRPGGRVVILEITTPQRPPLSSFFRIWFDRVVPALGRLAGDSQAYAYLPNSVKRFPGPEELCGVMERAGLERIRYLLTAGGIIALHVGVRA